MWHRKPRACLVWWCPWNELSTDVLGLDILYCQWSAVKVRISGTQRPLANRRSLEVLSTDCVTMDFGAKAFTRSATKHYPDADTELLVWLGDMGSHVKYMPVQLFVCFDKNQPPNYIVNSGEYLAKHSQGRWRQMGFSWQGNHFLIPKQLARLTFRGSYSVLSTMERTSILSLYNLHDVF